MRSLVIIFGQLMNFKKLIFPMFATAALSAIHPCSALPPSLEPLAEKSALSSFVIQPQGVVWTSSID